MLIQGDMIMIYKCSGKQAGAELCQAQYQISQLGQMIGFLSFGYFGNTTFVVDPQAVKLIQMDEFDYVGRSMRLYVYDFECHFFSLSLTL